ncbi:MAG: leucine-rich repeat protein [Clostridia bacterium]|nr:leucine-rich repeat protein [Clostridia bacterium]
MEAYTGNQPYIFISYAHADADRVIPILDELFARGFRIWYDAGIAVGSEWPEYIAEHLNGCTACLAFISKASLDSQNCRREINFAISKKKEPIAVYLEEVTLSLGMEMQLGTAQAIYYNRYRSVFAFVDALSEASTLAFCSDTPRTSQKTPSVPPVPPKNEPKPTPTPQRQNPILPPTAQNRRVGGSGITSTSTVTIGGVTYSGGGISVSGNGGTVLVNGTVVSGSAPPPKGYRDADGIEYRDNGNGTATVVGVADYAPSRLMIPSQCPRGNTVVAIGSYAMQNAVQLSHVSFPPTVRTVESYAFYNCAALRSLLFTSGIAEIGAYGFYNCMQLESVILPESLTAIGSYAFYNCMGLARVTFPRHRVAIGAYAFHNCMSLKTPIPY